MDRKTLEKMSKDELKKVANDLGVEYHQNSGAPKIVAAILAAVEGNGDEGDILPDTTAITEDDEGPTVDEVLAGGTVEVVDEKPAAPARLDVALSAKPDEKNKLEEVIRKEMTEWPTVEAARQALAGHVARGLTIVKLDTDYWHVKFQNREASGNLKMPLKVILQQATLLFQATARPTEGDDIEEILAAKMPRR